VLLASVSLPVSQEAQLLVVAAVVVRVLLEQTQQVLMLALVEMEQILIINGF